MRTLRLIVRATRLAVVTLLAYVVWLGGEASTWLGPRGGARRVAWRRRVMRWWARGVCRALAVEVEVLGEPPHGASFLVANHLSYLDIPVLASVVDTLFVSKHEIADWPLIGYLATRAGTIYVERSRKRSLPEVNERIRATLARGDGIVVFPEGTSTGGAEVLPFRAALLAPAAELGLSVRCAGLSYAVGPDDPPAAESVCWWRDMPFGPHVLGLLRLSGVRARVVFVPGALRSQDRKELAQQLRSAVSRAIQHPG